MTPSPFAALPGAVMGPTGIDHFGNPLAEQRALAAGEAIAPLDDRAVLAVPGADRLRWLDSITSQALTGLEPGVSTELLVLDPRGRVEHAAAVIDDGRTAWLIVDAGDAGALLEWLRRMRFRMDVDPADVSESYAVVGASRATALPATAIASPEGVPLVWVDPWPGVSPGGFGYAPAEPHPERPWVEAIVPREALAEVAASARPAGLLAVDALRIAAWRPRWSAEVDERLIPHEVDWLRTAVHLDKGCYRGQETVAKVHNLGHPPRRLVMLHLDGSDSSLPAPGSAVRAGADAVGAVTSVARHFEDGPIALAVVARSLADDAVLVVDTDDGPVAAAAEVIVPADAGATAGVPRMPRLSRRR